MKKEETRENSGLFATNHFGTAIDKEEAKTREP